jgi:predicted 3-demethylubiquinone-9 3-methyltransferase (glyoxalase superfamily)
MQIVTQKIAPCLWFDTEAEEAAKFYVSFRTQDQQRRPLSEREAGVRQTGRLGRRVVVLRSGARFVALNGGPWFHLRQGVLQVCASPRRGRYFWSRLTEGGEKALGWLGTDSASRGRSFRSRT